jgi:hypothetical protein
MGFAPETASAAELGMTDQPSSHFATSARRPHVAVTKRTTILKEDSIMSRTYEQLSEQQSNEPSNTNMPTTIEQHLPANSNDGWNDTAAEIDSRVIRGTLLKFADWKWSKGTEATEVEAGTQLLAIGTAAAWVKWKAGKPVQYIMREPGKALPDRDELDEPEGCGTWEAGPDGKPRDPWQDTRFVYLLDPMSVELLTFSISSSGGRSAVINLADQIRRMRGLGHPNALPIVELGAGPMPTRFGRKSKPLFKIIKWYSGSNGSAPKEVSPPSLKEELNDAIPFSL